MCRMGYPDYVLHRLWLHVHPWSVLFQNSLGYSVRALRPDVVRSTIPAAVTALAC